MKDSMLMYYEYEEYFNELSDAEGMKLLKAIFAYEKRGEILPLEGMAKAFFMVITNTLERNKDKYSKIIQARSAAGSKGAEAKHAKQTEANQANATEPQQTEAKQAVHVPVPVPEHVHVHVQEEKREPLFLVNKSGVTSNSGPNRIEIARKYWNESGAIPKERYTILQFSPDKIKECLATIQNFTDEEIQDSMLNYLTLLKSLDHEISTPFRSFIGFMRSGVGKFVSEADPFNAYRKKDRVPSGSGKESRYIYKPDEEAVSEQN